MLKKILLMVLLTFNIYASTDDANNTTEVNINTLSKIFQDMDTHAMYLLTKGYIDTINTQQNKDKVLKIYTEVINNLGILTTQAQRYIEDIDTKESKKKATILYLESLV